MREKLLILLKTEKLTSSRLAELLGIQPSNISHILSGRNKKPSFDFVQRILRRFPKINPDWLMLDSQQMYRDDSGSAGLPFVAPDKVEIGAVSGEGPAVVKGPENLLAANPQIIKKQTNVDVIAMDVVQPDHVGIVLLHPIQKALCCGFGTKTVVIQQTAA